MTVPRHQTDLPSPLQVLAIICAAPAALFAVAIILAIYDMVTK